MSSEAQFAFEQLEGAKHRSGEVVDVIAQAWADAEAVRAQARSEGKAAGMAEGLATSVDEARQGFEAIEAAVQALHGLRRQALAEAELDAVELAIRLAEHILAGAITVDPARVVEVARNALRHLTERRRVTLLVNPEDLAVMQEWASRLGAELGGIEHLAVQVDRRVRRGGAIARTEAGEIDASIDAQLARAREIVATALSTQADGA